MWTSNRRDQHSLGAERAGYPVNALGHLRPEDQPEDERYQRRGEQRDQRPGRRAAMPPAGIDARRHRQQEPANDDGQEVPALPLPRSSHLPRVPLLEQAQRRLGALPSREEQSPNLL